MTAFGRNAEATLRSAQVMLRWGYEGDLIAQLDRAASSQPGDLFLAVMRALVDVLIRKYPTVKYEDGAERELRVSLFEDASNHVLHINLDVPITTCNYRCTYCFLKHDVKPDLDKLKDLDRVIDRLRLIKRPLAVTFGPRGEIAAVPALWPYFSKLAELSNLVWLETWSNLSRDLEPLLKQVPAHKLNVIGTYHPTEFKSFERDNDAFFRRAAALQGRVADLTVNFVLCDENMPYLDGLRARLDALGIYLTFNPQVQHVNGYGEPIKPLDGEQREIARRLLDNPFLEYYFLEEGRADIRCTAGRDHINIMHDGKISRCEYFTLDDDEGLGNVLVDGGAQIDRVSRFCKRGGCACKNTIGYADPVVAAYKRVGTQHHFVKRAEDVIGTHSFDPVALPIDAEARAAIRRPQKQTA